jgi:protein involved in polysaccharide export with SLBB domain
MERNHVSMRLVLMSSLLIITLFVVALGQQSPKGRSKSESLDPLQRVVVTGDVRSPARFKFRENLRLKELLTCAGVLPDSAEKSVHVFRYGRGGDFFGLSGAEGPGFAVYSLAAVARGEDKSNPLVRGGHIIVVLDSEPIYVTGYVIHPQAVPSKGPVTLTQAIALAGGVTKNSKIDRIRIYRQAAGSTEQTLIVVDWKAITKRGAADLILQPYDVVEVPGKNHGNAPLGQPLEPFESLPMNPIC